MNRLVNSFLIGLVAFVGLLAAFVLSGLHGVNGGVPSPSAHAVLAQVTADWGASGPDGTDIELTLLVHHPGTVPARADAVEYQTVVDGIRFDQGTAPAGQAILAGKDTRIPATMHLGADFAARWWKAHAQGGEESELTIQGTLQIHEGEATRLLPFEWRSTWSSDIGRLLLPLADCTRSDQSVCLQETTSQWEDGTLLARLQLRYQGEPALSVRGGQMTLRFGTFAVAEGAIQAAPPDGQGVAEASAQLRFDPEALDTWWPAHVQGTAMAAPDGFGADPVRQVSPGCESSPAVVTVTVELEDADGAPAGTASWQTASTPFLTAFLCNGGAGP